MIKMLLVVVVLLVAAPEVAHTTTVDVRTIESGAIVYDHGLGVFSIASWNIAGEGFSATGGLDRGQDTCQPCQPGLERLTLALDAVDLSFLSTRLVLDGVTLGPCCTASQPDTIILRGSGADFGRAPAIAAKGDDVFLTTPFTASLRFLFPAFPIEGVPVTDFTAVGSGIATLELVAEIGPGGLPFPAGVWVGRSARLDFTTPEPSSVLLVSAGAGAWAWWRRRH
jgi:hypothetical protein